MTLQHSGGDDRSHNDDRLFYRLSRVDWDFRSYVPTRSAQGMNALHWYPAPFPSALAGTLIDLLPMKGGVYLDPFSGSGVGPLEAWIRGMRSYGVDNNQIAVRISQAKVDLLRWAEDREGERLARSFTDYCEGRLGSLAAYPPEKLCVLGGMQEEASSWFERDTLADIVIAKQWLSDVATPFWVPTLRVILSSLLHKASILRDVHYTYIVDRSRTLIGPKGPARLLPNFASKVVRVFREASLNRSELLSAGSSIERVRPPIFIPGRAEDIDRLIEEPVDLVVTSPPYFGMNDYVRSQYLSWLVDPWPGYEDDLSHESGARRDRRNAKKLREYLDTMGAALDNVAARLTPQGYVAMAVGQSQTRVAQEMRPVDELRQLICNKGFRLVWETQRRVRFRKINNASSPVEWIWIFQAVR